MIRKVYCVESFTEDGDLYFRRYARNIKTARQIQRKAEKRGYEVIIQDYTRDYKDGAPICAEWIEG